ncbi:MAG: cobalamin biosynthesis protein [Alkalimonas sp.]|nr:cobalamin biosynthesis protein [Alkalimonas sp.]
MPEHWIELTLHSPLLMLLAVLLAYLLPLPDSYHPLTFFRFFAQRLGQKVNPDPERSRQQQRLSGTLAIAVAILPWLFILVAFLQLSALPQVFEAILLYLLLDISSRRQRIVKLQQALQQQQLSLSRDLASLSLLRQTRPLSALGLSKAAIESLWLNFSQVWFTTLLWFLLFGIWPALVVRLLAILHQEWSTKLQHNRDFGVATAWLSDWLQKPGYWLCFFLICLRFRCRRSIQRYRQQTPSYFHRAQLACLAGVSASLNCRLGGPVLYNTDKVQRDKIGQAEPEPDHRTLKNALLMQQSLIWFSLVLLLAYTLLWWAAFFY